MFDLVARVEMVDGMTGRSHRSAHRVGKLVNRVRLVGTDVEHLVPSLLDICRRRD